MINVYNKQRQKVAVLQNAFDVTETIKINAVSELSFSLPSTDEKAALCQPYFYVRYGNDGDLYRIISAETDESDVSVTVYSCEHVIATLIDKVLFGTHITGGIDVYTVDVIAEAIAGQNDWALGECDFSFQYEYGWENENLLGALFSVPELFVDPYVWKFNTNVYPWTVSLKRIDDSITPQYYLRAKKNILSSTNGADSAQICTRLYLLGAGEGVNQVTVSSINGGLPYIQNDDAIAQYGVIERIFVDSSFDEPASLLERGRALLAGYSSPQYSRSFSAIDLYPLTNDVLDKAIVGNVVKLEDGTKTYITQVQYNRDVPGDMDLTLSTSPADIADSIADLADRQRIESVYSQGATQIYAQSVQANATYDHGAALNFYIPKDMKYINFVNVKIKMSAFRSYTSVTEGGGGSTQTSSSGGGTSKSTDSSPSSSDNVTSESGGGSTVSSTYTTPSIGVGTGATDWSVGEQESGTQMTSVDGHRHTMYAHGHKLTVLGGSHSHNVSIPSHTHNVRVTVPAHSHGFSVPSHTHSVSIPAHSHNIKPGIFSGGSSSSAGIYVNGTLKQTMGTSGELDITELLLGTDGKIARGTWHEIEVVPNNQAYITIDLFVKGFIQSRGGSTY